MLKFVDRYCFKDRVFLFGLADVVFNKIRLIFQFYWFTQPSACMKSRTQFRFFTAMNIHAGNLTAYTFFFRLFCLVTCKENGKNYDRGTLAHFCILSRDCFNLSREYFSLWATKNVIG